MPDEPEGDGTTESFSEAERQAFYDTANEFIDIANAAIADSDHSAVNAAFLYSCSRYNVYMQKMATFGAEIEEEAKAYLLDQFEKQLRGHMQDDLRHELPEGFSDRTSEVLGHLDDELDAEDGRFLSLVDRFIGKANELHRRMPIGRVSACFMHACARFNVHIMQLAGMAPGAVHEAEVDRYAGLYAMLVERHNAERLETHTSTWIRDRSVGALRSVVFAFVLRVVAPCVKVIRRFRR
jgi:hypothetical protein